jgi:hypothetical protein
MDDLTPEEKKRRERLVIEDFDGIQPMFEAFYLEGIRYAAKCSVEAFERYEDAVENRDRDEVVAHAHEALSHAAAVSRFFWPPAKPGTLRAHRAAKLRKSFKLDDASPLANRDLRNALEHFDERLDEYLLGDHVGYFFPGPMVDNSDLADEELGHIFRLVDPMREVFVLYGQKFEFGPIRDAVWTILNGADDSFSNGGRLEARARDKPMVPVPQHLREDFRSMAKEAVKRASVELDTKDDDRLRYACVDLRLALEALTYDRATAYRDELPPEHFSTWQPGRLLKVLLEIDPKADRTKTIRVGVQPYKETSAPTMKIMGTDVALSLKTIKEHYDALSSFIHMPTLKKVEEGWKADPASVRNHCDVVAGAVQKVVDSRLFRSTMAETSEIPCFRCKTIIRRRIPRKTGIGETKCYACGAPHRYSMEPDGKVLWQPMVQSVPCATEGCDEVLRLFDDQLKEETNWKCDRCGVHYGIFLSVHRVVDGGPG